MNLIVGDVVSAITHDVRGKSKAKKHHLCVCTQTGAFLFVCSKKYECDFALPHEECTALENVESYISLSRVINVSGFSKSLRPRVICRVSNGWLTDLAGHAMDVPTLTASEQIRVVSGITSFLSNKSA